MVRPHKLSSTRLSAGARAASSARKAASSPQAISISAGLSVASGCESRRRSRPLAPCDTCVAFSIAAISATDCAISGRLSAVAIG